MGLYLCVFATDEVDEELEGVDVGGYDDFHEFRQAVCDHVENGSWASKCPVLMNHSDSDGTWSSDEAAAMSAELGAIEGRFRQLPPRAAEGWKQKLFRMYGTPRSLADYFIDVDGEPLIQRLSELAAVAVRRSRPISFQ
jgi:hypothetical protein